MIRSERLSTFGGLDVGREALFAVALDENSVDLAAVGHGDLVDFLDLAGDARVDGSADKGVAPRDLLADVDRVADLDHRLARRADMLGHRQSDHGGHRHDHALFVRGILVVRSVYAALGAVRPLGKAELSHRIPPLFNDN